MKVEFVNLTESLRKTKTEIKLKITNSGCQPER